MTAVSDPPEGADEDGGWEERRLCGDESCIGVIGPDGRCKECGRPAEGAAPQPAPAPAVRERPEAPEPAPVAEEAASSADPASDDDWDRRRLCSDDSCIGVIGPDGRCKECGRPAEG